MIATVATLGRGSNDRRSVQRSVQESARSVMLWKGLTTMVGKLGGRWEVAAAAAAVAATATAAIRTLTRVAIMVIDVGE
jgi:hypothetical protein